MIFLAGTIYLTLDDACALIWYTSNLTLLSKEHFAERTVLFMVECKTIHRISHITIVETTDSGERGMNPVAMTIINPRKEYWPSRGSNQRLPVLKSATLPTELWGSATNDDGECKIHNDTCGMGTNPLSMTFSPLYFLTPSLIHHFETVPSSKKLQTTTEMWLLGI